MFNDLARCERLRRFFYRNLEGIGYGVLKSPVGKTALMRGFAAGKTTYEITNTFFLSPFFQPGEPLTLRDFLSKTREDRISHAG
jgi:hypothetical protein